MLATTAEQLAFRDAPLDAVTVDSRPSIGSITTAPSPSSHVLRPGGRVGLVWNSRDRSVDWVDGVWSIIDRVEKRAPWRDHDHFRDSAYRDLPGFGDLHSAQFRHAQTVTPEAMVQRVPSAQPRGGARCRARPCSTEVRALLATIPSRRAGPRAGRSYRVDALLVRGRSAPTTLVSAFVSALGTLTHGGVDGRSDRWGRRSPLTVDGEAIGRATGGLPGPDSRRGATWTPAGAARSYASLPGP